MPPPYVLKDAAAARAVGAQNILPARVVEQLPSQGITLVEAAGCQLALVFRDLPLGSALTVIISRDRITQTSARNLLAGNVRHVIHDEPVVELVIDCGVDLKVKVPTQAAEALGLRPGVTVYLLIKASACHVLD